MQRSTLGLAVLAACGGGGSHKLADACLASGTVTATMTGPSDYACHDPYMMSLTVVNTGCDPVVVQGITLSATTSGTGCEAPGDFTYQPQVAVVEGGQTAVVLAFTGNQFCCRTMDCPTPFQCDDTFTATINTDGAPIVATNSAHLSLDGCDVICP